MRRTLPVLVSILVAFILTFFLSPIGIAEAATFTVNTLDNLKDGTCNATHCSLRDAIVAANALAGTDIIDFAPTLSGQTIVLDQTDVTYGGPVGLPLIVSPITVNGGGTITISGNDARRVVVVDSGSLTLNGVTIRDGYILAVGGTSAGMYVDMDASATVNNSTFTDNVVEGPGAGGAGITNTGSLTITNSTISGNRTIWDSNVVGGTGILNQGTLNITNSTISGNTSSPGVTSSGGALYNSNGTATITNSTISGNTAANAGAIYAALGVVNLSFVTVTANSAANGTVLVGDNSSAINIRNSIIVGNGTQECSGQVFFSASGESIVGSNSGLQRLCEHFERYRTGG